MKSLENNKPYFNQIIIAEPCLFETISQQLSDYLLSHSYSLENIRVLCNDEYLLPTAAKIRELFNFSGDKLNDILKFTDKIKIKEVISTKIKLPKYIYFDSSKYQISPHNYL